MDGKVRSLSPPLSHGVCVTAIEAARNDVCDFRGRAIQATGFFLVTMTLPLQTLSCHVQPRWKGHREVLCSAVAAGLVLWALQTRRADKGVDEPSPRAPPAAMAPAPAIGLTTSHPNRPTPGPGSWGTASPLCPF